MNYTDAKQIADEWADAIRPFCEENYVQVVGSVRRRKRDVHDIEILAKPILKAPVPTFGDKRVFSTALDKFLFERESRGDLKAIKGGSKMKQYFLNLERYKYVNLDEFKIEFYLVTPPAQWGVGMVIRTGPGSPIDNFSKWCVTNRSANGALPDGYKVRHLAVWKVEQLDAKEEPLKGESPLAMPDEMDFLNFLGLGWMEPANRHNPKWTG